MVSSTEATGHVLSPSTLTCAVRGYEDGGVARVRERGVGAGRDGRASRGGGEEVARGRGCEGRRSR